MILVGHVTKDGQIAGPRVVEHMVDAVLYFEGDPGHHFRILRAVKNRFGPTDEIGVFEMTDRGLAEVPNPSALFLAEPRSRAPPGTAVFAGMEGTRPVLVEIQALVAPASLGTPRRAVVGWDPSRLSMVLAVLEAHGGLRLGMHDVYLNVAGGLRISRAGRRPRRRGGARLLPLGRAAARPTRVYFGEIGLSGAIRPVAQAPARLKEAAKLGFASAVAPHAARRQGRAPASGVGLDRPHRRPRRRRSPPPPVHGRSRCSGAGKGDAASFAVYTRGQPARPGHARFRQACGP